MKLAEFLHSNQNELKEDKNILKFTIIYKGKRT